METAKLKKFAQFARRSLIEQVSAKLKLVLAENSAARREKPAAVAEIEKQIFNSAGKYTDACTLTAEDSLRQERLIERVAYTWFNRFCALRFMDVNRYTRIGVVSPAEGQFQPEILAEAKMGHIDDEMVPDRVRQQVFALLAGSAPSRDPQGEAYRLLVVAACNFFHRAMPFLFQRIDDYTELLMPDDLLSAGSILACTREAMTPDACEDVEVIGWLYQFYISEKKDEVFDGLKKNKKITPENIPAATQLFTPHWIVRYLVENSLGRLWLLNRPGSKLVEQMDYYIKPEQAETDFLRITKPEEIKICDPACGSGHMLTYAFDLLYAIYEEEGYEPAEIPSLILTKNLYGIEIDERAGELAALALTMKARARQRRFFTKGVRPNICVLGNVQFDEGELQRYMDFVGRDLFTYPLQSTLRQFEEADNFGSLIRPDVTDVAGMLRILESKNVSGQLHLYSTHRKVLQALRQADYLSPKYHVVIANPPYMGGKGMNGRLSAWLKANYPESKSDLMTCFMDRLFDLSLANGYWGMINLPSWMFLTSYEDFRKKLLSKQTILSLVHLGRGIFGSDFGTVAFTAKNQKSSSISKGVYRRLFNEHVQVRSPEVIECLFLDKDKGRYVVPQREFYKIPGCPIAYWTSSAILEAFATFPSMKKAGHPCSGLQTGDNDRYLKQWYEVAIGNVGFNITCLNDAEASSYYWFPHKKGGPLRRWYGNCDYVVDWRNCGASIKSNPSARPQNTNYWFREGVTWSHTSSGAFSARISEQGFTFNVEGPTYFSDRAEVALGFLCSAPALYLMQIMNSSLHFLVGSVSMLPIAPDIPENKIEEVVTRAINLAKNDWNYSETAWDFSGSPLLNPDYRQPTLKATYRKLRAHWREMTLEMLRLEEENNRIFIEAYGLKDELDEEVDLNEITLTCNPHYRYGNDKSEEELEALLLADTMRELVSYAVGCMFGRYALDKPGLILANQGETIEDYLKQVPEPSFPADDDNVIPLLDGDWFTDDIAERFRKFLRVSFGEEHYEENLRFVEQALNIKGKRNYSIRDYFLGEFYADHVRRYKKRPIYWLFSSPRGSFNALVYMHRYRPHTVSVVLNDYLREFRTKLTAHKNHLEAVSISGSASQADKTKALKEIEKVNRMIAEMEEYEREVLYPLATRQVEIDLDDGVKANYPKLGAALKKIVGLDAQED